MNLQVRIKEWLHRRGNASAAQSLTRDDGAELGRIRRNDSVLECSPADAVGSDEDEGLAHEGRHPSDLLVQ